MKKLSRIVAIPTVLCILGLGYLVPSTFAAPDEVRLYMTPVNVGIAPGATTTLQIRLSKTDGVRVDHVDAAVTFPSGLLEVTALSKAGGYFTANNGPTMAYNNAAGTLRVTGNGTTLSASADVLVATATFRTKAAGTARVNYSTSSQAGDMVGTNNIKNYLTGTAGSTLTITSPVTPNPTTPKPPAPTPSTPSPPITTPQLTPEESEDPTTSPKTGSPDDSPAPETDANKSATPASSNTKRSVLLYAILGLGIGLCLYVALKRRRRKKIQRLNTPETVTSERTHDDLSVDELLATIDSPNVTHANPAQPFDAAPTFAANTVSEAPAEQPPIDSSTATAQPAPTNNTPRPVIVSLKRGGFGASSPKVDETPIHSDAKRIILQVPNEQPIVVPQATTVVSPQTDSPQPVSPSQQMPPAKAQTSLSPLAQPPDMFESGEQRLEQEGYTSNRA